MPSAQRSGKPFGPARGRRVFDDIVDQIRERLKNDELQPGDRLPSERQLSEQFDVSRNTVREALRMLEIAGLIEIRKGATGGAFIATSDPDKVATGLTGMLSVMAFSLSDLTEVRLWLGTLITRLACKRATDDDLARLRANVDRAAELTASEEWKARSAVNHEFLNLLAAATANPILEMMQLSITDVIREIVEVVGSIEDDSILVSRRRLLGYLEQRDADQAAKEMQTHLQRVHEYWLQPGLLTGPKSRS